MGSDQRHALATLEPRYPLDRRLGGPQKQYTMSRQGFRSVTRAERCTVHICDVMSQKQNAYCSGKMNMIDFMTRQTQVKHNVPDRPLVRDPIRILLEYSYELGVGDFDPVHILILIEV
jgi:hypothetical protein